APRGNDVVFAHEESEDGRHELVIYFRVLFVPPGSRARPLPCPSVRSLRPPRPSPAVLPAGSRPPPGPSVARLMHVCTRMMTDHEVALIDDSVSEFTVILHGPADSPYEGGVWKIRVELPPG